jgi:hypothetical protein
MVSKTKNVNADFNINEWLYKNASKKVIGEFACKF